MPAAPIDDSRPAGEDASSPAVGASMRDDLHAAGEAAGAASGAAPAPAQSTPGPRLTPTLAHRTAFERARADATRREAEAVQETLVRDARGARRPSALLGFAGLLCGAVGLGALVRAPDRPAGPPAPAPVTRVSSAGAEVVASVAPAAVPTRAALGKSGAVQLHTALPGATLAYPLEVQGDPTDLAYQWVRASDSAPADAPRPLVGAEVVAPPRPGIYRLALVRGNDRRVVEGVSLAVLVPFAYKLGASLNGYRIGTYRGERWGGERPDGFLEVDRGAADLQVSEHLRLRDFLTRDEQTQWPRYAVVSPRILDKLELVLAEVNTLRGGRKVQIEIDIHSGFRTPSHNARVEGSAVNSRHQFGDAVDLAIDADGDGRLTSFDGRVIAAIVEFIERKHPELVGGLGLYVGPGHVRPYVHIDARGTRARWWG